MALKVIGDVSFFAAVREALRRICPAARVADSGDVFLVDISCDAYCEHRAGCNLLQDLVDLKPTTVRIVEDDSSSDYWDVTSEIDYFIDGTWVEWCDEDDCLVGGSHLQDKAATLAHELIHAWHHHITKTFPAGTWSLDEENCTVCAENQIRQEMGIVPRCRYEWWTDCTDCSDDALAEMKTYGGYDCKLLDDSSHREDCDCTVETSDTDCGCMMLPLCWLRDRVVDWANPQRVERSPPSTGSGAHQRVPADWSAQSHFAELLESDDQLVDEIRRAARGLVLRREREGSPEFERQFREADDAAFLELVDLHGGYRVILFSLTDEGAAFGTNFDLRMADGRQILGSQGDLRLYNLSGESAQRIRAALRSPTFGPPSAGIGGRFVWDGQAQFLRVKTGGAVRKTAARAFRFRGDLGSTMFRPPDDHHDSARWDAVKTVLDLGLSQLLDLGDPVVLRHRLP